MLVLKSRNHFLQEGRWDKSCKFFCPEWSNLLKARLFESEKQMLTWLKDETNYQPWRLNAEQPDWKLVPYAHEAADLITKLIERMA